MRHAIRIQPYLSRDLFQKLRAYAAARSQTVSGVVADALGAYLERDEPDEDLLARRLDRVTQTVEQLGRDLDALGVGFGRFVRYSLWTLPEKVDEKTIQRGEGLYRTFLTNVGQQIRAGGTFTAQVFPTRRPTVVAPDPSIRDEIKAIVSNDNGNPSSTAPENEPLIDAHAAGKLLGMSAPAVRAAAFRGTLRSHHIGRLLRFRPSELLPQRRPARSSSR